MKKKERRRKRGKLSIFLSKTPEEQRTYKVFRYGLLSNRLMEHSAQRHAIDSLKLAIRQGQPQIPSRKVMIVFKR